MERIPFSPPSIKPILNNTIRPLWSVMIPVFNCSEFMMDALQSVLMQDMGEDLMQIEVIDDCSTDADVEALVRKIGQGRVKYYRQHKNVGSLRNFETCINRSQGELVHLLHGDDRVKMGFYKNFSKLFQTYPQAGASFCRYHSIDETGNIMKEGKFKNNREGILKDGLLIMAGEQPTQYVATVVKREVYEKLGSFYGVVFGEDWEMWVRIAKNYPIAYTPALLADYRRHIGSISRPKKETGQNARDLATTIFTIEKHLSENMKHLMVGQKRMCRINCIKSATKIWKQTNDRKKADELVRLALSIKTNDLYIYYLVMKFYVKVIFNIKNDSPSFFENFHRKGKMSSNQTP
ncbi:MAG: glycosyltransferase [Cyclobacteriaceae bacterium]